MATRTAQKRLTREYKGLLENPTAYIEAHPNEENVLEWFYIITGPPDTPYEGGQYMGTLTFPSDYPFNPPAIRMLTPSGRFDPGSRLCLSISDYHPKTWNPSWSVATILVGLLSFMTSNEHTAGSITTTVSAKQKLAKLSKAWNLNDPRFIKQYPELVKTQSEEVKKQQQQDQQQNDYKPSNSYDFGVPTWLYVAGIALFVGALYKIM